MGTATITHHVVGQGGKYIAHLEGEDAKGTLEWEPGDEVDGKEVPTRSSPKRSAGAA